MRRELTRRQKKILDFITQSIQDQGYPPTIREIGEEFGISSTNGVRDHLKALVRKGYIRRNAHTSRGIELVDYLPKKVPVGDVVRVPIVGSVAAGQPILATENIEGTIVVDKLLSKDEDVFALKVKGDSMVNAGILDGDYALVRRQPSAEKGEIAAAIIDDEATLKRYYPEENYIRLQPENDNMEPIIVEKGRAEVRIVGKVIGIVRRIE